MYEVNENILEIEDENTWPTSILAYLDGHYVLIKSWANRTSNSEANDNLIVAFDNIILGLKPKLNPHYLVGYHCTRLTDWEIEDIELNGMSLPNFENLKTRLEKLVKHGTIANSAASQFIMTNEADAKYRKNRIWFCFFEPHLEGESGIGRFFKSWGGEALYVLHEQNLDTGKILGEIGTPCIIKAKVPFSGFDGHSFELNFIRRYMINRGLETGSKKDYEGCIVVNLPAANIIDITRFPTPRFMQLTKCDTWDFTL